MYCLPILKTEADRRALVQAATSGNPKFFAGTDSAPHVATAKECDHGCAGIFSANAALELYATVFDAADALEKLEAFVSEAGANFYGLPLNARTVTLRHETHVMPASFEFPDATGQANTVVPLLAGQELAWQAVLDTEEVS